MATFTTASTGIKPIDTLILDAGPILSSAAAPSFYLASADRILTTPAVIAEIRDAAARTRFETVWAPFVQLRSPRPESLQAVAAFAKKTGDYAVLSKTDLALVALGYEVELEVAGGDWRLRKVPGQKELNGPLPEGWGWEGKILEGEGKAEEKAEGTTSEETTSEETTSEETTLEGTTSVKPKAEEQTPEQPAEEELASKLAGVALTPESAPAVTFAEEPTTIPELTALEVADESDSDSDSDSEGWITPSNLHKHIQTAPTPNTTTAPLGTQKLTVALATTDFALQNVLLQLNLHLLSPTSLCRITHTRSTVLRCHACFLVVRNPPPTSTQSAFCPRCGGAKTLLRTTCSTDAQGVFRIHLKKNFQWNNRGNVYSLPKPQHGTSSMKGVARAPVLREDQKEYERAIRREGYHKEKDLLDEDYSPSILSGARKWGNDIALGVGRRNPNVVKRSGGGKKKKGKN